MSKRKGHYTNRSEVVRWLEMKLKQLKRANKKAKKNEEGNLLITILVILGIIALLVFLF